MCVAGWCTGRVLQGVLQGVLRAERVAGCGAGCVAGESGKYCLCVAGVAVCVAECVGVC